MTLMVAATNIPSVLAAGYKDGFDNNYPRLQKAHMTGFGARAQAAHENSLEFLAYFGLAAIMAHVSKVDATVSSSLCVATLLYRAMFLFGYWLNLDKVRSIFWGLAFMHTMGLMGLSIFPGFLPDLF
eukprot:NODE_7145_length_789_cov_104.983483_g6906_i0.p1 GENE.NODE_7145_length_789_cov_104.983483_g6906_i0~~NODE_7145_length_789_cov_104.983483_g6906_i0.p1  ORF type:complete len:127 (-),score=14.64 NODE_7145_length_789_cov_104.983483_g6906_i0:161-541(-)